MGDSPKTSLVQSAAEAAQEAGAFPNLLGGYDVVSGPKADSVVMEGTFGGWILAVRERGQDGWYVSDDLTEGGARGAAVDYAHRGL